MTRLDAINDQDFDGGAGLDGAGGKPTLAERLTELYASATYLGPIATADLPETDAEWRAIGQFTEAPTTAGWWFWDTTTNSAKVWDGSTWRGMTGATQSVAVSSLMSIGPVAADSGTAVHALYDDVNAAFPGPFTNPDVPRNLVVVMSASWDGGDVEVTGTDQFDAVITETFTAGDGVTRTGNKVFKTVTGATKSIPAGVAGNGASIGTGDKIGVPAELANTSGVAYVGTTIEAVTLNATYNSAVFTTNPAATTFLLHANILTN